MKTKRAFRIFMMALELISMAFLRLFRRFTHLKTYHPSLDPEAGVRAVPATEKEARGIKTALILDGEKVESYRRREEVSLEAEEPYAKYQGIVTFRGDQLRSGASYGEARVKEKKLRVKWERETGKLKKAYGKGFWTGSGWTGQPLLLHFTPEEKAPMNLYPEKKAKDLVEAIYSTMDGKVYFLDLEDGSDTRDKIEVGLPFKGAGAVHPSLPILHLGPGDGGPGEEDDARGFLYSLIDGSKLYEYGRKDPFARRVFHGFDSSPLFLGDYLFEPAENGILYSFKLNSRTDEQGKISVAPSEFLRLAYETGRSGDKSYWLGMEDSAVVWKNYLYVADNGGTLLCVNLNTMEVVWAQDVADDTNGSPVFSLEEGLPYLYIGTSLHWTASKRLKMGDVPFFKISALTGEYVWTRTYFCCTIAGISGGVQATAVKGERSIEDLIIVPFARTPSVQKGILVALDKKTGREVWRFKQKGYSWSSPVAVYDGEEAYILLGDSTGRLYLLNGRTGKCLHKIKLGSNIEASPAVYGNTLVVGTRGMKIFGVEIL